MFIRFGVGRLMKTASALEDTPIMRIEKLTKVALIGEPGGGQPHICISEERLIAIERLERYLRDDHRGPCKRLARTVQNPVLVTLNVELQKDVPVKMLFG